MDTKKVPDQTTLAQIETGVKQQNLKPETVSHEIIEASPEHDPSHAAPIPQPPVAASDDPLNPPPAEIIEDSPE